MVRNKESIGLRVEISSPSCHPDLPLFTKTGKYAGLCKQCYGRAWLAAQGPEFTLKGSARTRLKKYGISQEDSAALLASQKGLCLICKSDGEGKSLHLDHCHASGLVRGFLCQKCNQALGMFRDNTDTIRNAIDYLRKYQ